MQRVGPGEPGRAVDPGIGRPDSRAEGAVCHPGRETKARRMAQTMPMTGKPFLGEFSS